MNERRETRPKNFLKKSTEYIYYIQINKYVVQTIKL